MCDKVNDYLKTTGRKTGHMPMLYQFYKYIGINPDTADEWKDRYVQFSDACKKVEAAQKSELMDTGLYSGKSINAAMAIFLLKVNHGMVETEKKILSGESNAPISVKIVKDVDK